jgi:hypothetical protein
LTAVKHSEIKKEFDPHGLIEVPNPHANRLGEDVNAEGWPYKFAIGKDTMHLLKQFPKEWAGDWIFDLSVRQMARIVEFIKALGERRCEAIDIYDRIDREELRHAYLAFIPQLGI